MVPDDLHDFFVAGAGVAGALVGLLFVAISVSGNRLTPGEKSAPIHRIRAAASLTAFTNALTVSLFALIPGHKIAPTSISLGGVGLAFVLATLIALFRARLLWSRRMLDAAFVVGLAVAFTYQLIWGLRLSSHPDDAGTVNSIAVLVVIFFLVGVTRAWELIGGPAFGFTSQVVALVRHPHEPETENGGGSEVAGGGDGHRGGVDGGEAK